MELKVKSIQFHTILNNVLFPINDQKLISDLSQFGYKPAQQGQMIKNQIIVQPGDFAVKNNTVLTLNAQSKMVQVTGLNPDEVYTTWKEVEKILSSQEINLKSTGRLFELKSEYIVSTGKNPLKSFARMTNANNLDTKFEKIIPGKPPTQISFRFIPKDGLVDTEDFYDIRLECLLRNAKQEYFVQIIYRNKKQDVSEKLLKNLENKVTEIVNLVNNE